tara:strand:+ start:2841 stop:4034 length:1194 start_codon:yes stop_codon:yes gene_type:complete
MSNLKALDDKIELREKRVLVRVDLNVPISDGKISDNSRIKKIIPLITNLIEKKAKIILISHLGRPKGKFDEKLSLRPVAAALKELIETKIEFFEKSYGPETIEKSKKIKPGEILLLENIRFNKEEELNAKSFSKELSKMGDIYINEAFSCSHRAHASVCEITNHIDSFAGKMLIEEVNLVKMLTSNPQKPVTCIIGGSKISSKIGILTNLIKRIQTIVIVGAMANNFIKYKGLKIGNSLLEENQDNLVKDILKQCKISNCNMVIPEDVIVSKNHNGKGQLKNVDQIDDTDIILDIGEKTFETIAKSVDDSKTVFWNGPAGYFEVKEFSFGTKKIAKKISENTKNRALISIAGGGDTIAAINRFGCSDGFTYISTAGGAFLELLEGKILPGIKVLEVD